MNNRSTHIDQWRGISVLLVVIQHLIDFRFRPQFEALFALDTRAGLPTKIVVRTAEYLSMWSAGVGSVGVQIFFLISGYIITVLLLKERAAKGRVSFPAFYTRRLCRIVPPMMFFVAGMMAAYSAGWIHKPDWLAAMSFLCNVNDCSRGFGHFWSLAVEQQFYLMWPAIFILLPRHRVAVAATAACVFLAFGFVGSGINNGLSFACIAVGVLFAVSPRFQQWMQSAGRLPRPLLYIAVLALLPFLKTRYGSLAPWLHLIAPFLICATVLGHRAREDVTSHRVAARALAWLGLISYSVYLWQGMWTMAPAEYVGPGSYFALIGIPMAYVSYRLVELPFVALGHRLSKPKLAPPGHPST